MPIWLGLTAIWTDTVYPDILPDVLPILCHPIQQQEQLGWALIHWAMAIDATHPNSPQAGEQIMIQLVKTIWTYILNTWKIRNQHLHKVANQLDLPNYGQAAMTLYELCHKLPPDAQVALY